MKNGLHTSMIVIMMLITLTMPTACAQAHAIIDPTDMPGRVMFEGLQLNQVNPDMDMAYPERLDQFLECRDVPHDMPDWRIDSWMNRTVSMTSIPDRSVHDRLADKDMAYQQVNLDMDVTPLERFERSQEPDIRHDMPDELIDSRIDRTMLGKGTPDRSAQEGLAGKNMGYRTDTDSDMPLVMSVTTPSECSFTYGFTAGDFNGDDRDDVLMFSGTYNSTTGVPTFEYVSAVNGDGTELWNQSITGDYVYMYAYPCGDLDGDDLDDVIVESWSYNSTTDEETASVYARRGYDGTEFWSQSITDYWADMYAYPCGDLDGDDLDDVIVKSRSYNSTTDEYTYSVQVRQGYIGTEFWNQSITGDYVYMYAYPCGDLDGDDLDDVIVESWSYNSTTDEETASVYARRGYDGTEFWNQSITGDYVYMYAYPCGDLDGDDLDDVIVESGSYNSTTDEETASVYARRGYDGTEFWNQSITDYWADMYAYPCGDLDGDDLDDVIVESRSYNSTTDEETYSVYARRGYDGTEFWNQSITGDYVYMYAYPCGDLDGDDLDDVIVESGSYNSTTDEETASVYARRGYDGTEFWSQSITDDDVYIYVHSYCDLDGDDLDDVIVKSRSYNSTTDEYTYSVQVRQGYTGTEFWNQSITGDYVYMYAYPCGDLDGDDLDDVIVESGSYNSTTDEETASVYARRGYDGTEFWSQSITDDDVYIYVHSYCDLDGDDLDDVIVKSRSYNSTTDEYTYSVQVRQGYTGTEFWNQSITGDYVYMYAYPCGDLDGDDLDDVIVESGSYNSTTDEETYSVYARRGYDGTEFWSQSITGEDAYIDAYLCGDLDGDDLDDVIVESWSYNSTTDEETYSVHVRQGDTGTEFWSQSITGEDVWMEIDYYNWDYWHQDFDGDNLNDVLITTGIFIGYEGVPTKVCAVKGNDGTSLWCSPLIASVEISPPSADLLINETQQFTATCNDTRNNPMSGCALTWTCDSPAVGTINSTGLFTAGGVGTATVTVTAMYEGKTMTDTAVVNVSATETVYVDGDNFTAEVGNITMNGTFTQNVTGNITMTLVPDPEVDAGNYQLITGNAVALMGLNVTPDAAIAEQMADGNGTIRIEICYNETELASKGISLSTLALWRFNESTNEWVKMVKGTLPCVDNGITGNCVWIEVNNLSTFALVGTKTTSRCGGGGSGSGGTYPPGWGTTTTTPVVTATAAHRATPGATAAPPGEHVTPAPTKKTVAAKATATAAEGTTAGTAKKDAPGFPAVFAIAGILAVAYAMMRRRE